MFNSIIDQVNGIEIGSALLCTLVSVGLGFVVALVHMSQGRNSKSFLISLVLLPAIVQLVIMMVNGNIGAGVAVFGAFSLIRFRSVPGSAKEIVSVFLAMAIGIATGMGYLMVAITFTIIICLLMLILYTSKFGEKKNFKRLKIIIPEDLNYKDVFKDILLKYTNSYNLIKVKTTNLGSLYELLYEVVMKHGADEKQMIDELRIRNANLKITLKDIGASKDEL